MQKNSVNFACEMKKKLFWALIILLIQLETLAQNVFLDTQSPSKEPLHEMRAVWLATIGGIDWPHSYSRSLYSELKQKQELCDILDNLSAAGINTVLMQTRIRATTIFPSTMEPWDGCLSGIPTQSPGYDALAFAIDECHKRGMKFHAWVVAIPVGKWDGAGCKALRKSAPSVLKRIGNEGFMNPEADGTASYLARFCKDVAARYDVDGIHLDYIRYPEAWKKIKSHDKGRECITRIVRAIRDAVKEVKPWVMLSCSPIGKYADTKRQWSNGWNARDVVCQDAAQWLEDGLMDALFPMMYFRGDNFYPFLIDWKERSANKIVTPGLGIYFLDEHEKNWALGDITQEMHVLRQFGMGNCMFRSKFFTDNTKGLYDYTKTVYSRTPSLQPAMTWYAKERPAVPWGVAVTNQRDGTWMLSWQADTTSASCEGYGGSKVLYNVYGSDTAPVDTKVADNLLMAAYEGTSIVVPQGRTVRHFAVTATDRYGNESEPCQSFAGDAIGSEGAKPNVPGKTLEDDGRYVWLDECDVTLGQLLEIHSLVGTVVTSCFVREQYGRLFINAQGMAAGHYVVYLINRKGHRHRLGTFSRAVC